MEPALTQIFSSSPRAHWARLDEFSFVAGMRLLVWLYRMLGRWPFRVVLYPVVFWYMMTRPVARAASRRYLARVAAFRGPSHNQPGDINVLRHFASFAENLLDKMLLWGGRFDTDSVKLHGVDFLAGQIAAKRGGILICSHFGNLELCRVMSKRQPGLKLTVLTHTKHARRFNRLLAQLNPDSQLNLIEVTELTSATAMMLAEKIERGEFIAIAGDRIPVSRNPWVAFASFLGVPAPFPAGPYILASALRCPAYLMFALRGGRGSEIYFEIFRDSICLPRQNRRESLAALAADYAERLERFCLSAPLQWFNFYDFWHLPVTDAADASH